MLPTIASFRWRCGLVSGPTNPVHDVMGYWSDDGQLWREARPKLNYQIVLGLPKPLTPSVDVCDEIVELTTSRTEEPLGRQLFREAWSQRDIHPRSALVIGVAAAEVGFKKLVGSLVPQVQWLMDEVQTPPLGRMLRKLLPKLPVKGRVPGKCICPPNTLLKQLDDAITHRNKAVHAGEPPPHLQKLNDMLLAINDFLWACDVYAGQVWAHEHISATTKRHWLGEEKDAHPRS